MLSLSSGCAISASVRDLYVYRTVDAARSGAGSTSSTSNASPVTSIPLASSRFLSTLANQKVGLPAEIDSRAGGAPTGIEPAMVRNGSPGRCSGQSSGDDPGAPVT